MEQKVQTISEHYGELRLRAIFTFCFFIISLIMGFIGSLYIIDFIKNTPPANSMTLNVFSPWDGFKVYTAFSLFFTLPLLIPFIMYQIYAFLKPGLNKNEQFTFLLYVPLTFFCFFCGFLFSYLGVIPVILHFTLSVNNLIGLNETYGITNYLSFLLSLIIPISLLFELPIVVAFLTKIGLISPNTLKQYRRYSYIVLAIFSTIITPPDFFSALFVMFPFILLYEISIWVSHCISSERSK